MKATEERLTKKIEDSQEDTIDALSELIHTGYTMLEERITTLEKHAGLQSPDKN